MPGFRQTPEVLSDSCEQELIASAAHSAQPQASQVQDAFEVREQHLNFLSIFARLPAAPWRLRPTGASASRLPSRHWLKAGHADMPSR